MPVRRHMESDLKPYYYLIEQKGSWLCMCKEKGCGFRVNLKKAEGKRWRAKEEAINYLLDHAREHESSSGGNTPGLSDERQG